MTDEKLDEISAKLNVLIALAIRNLSGQSDFTDAARKHGVGDIVRYLDDLGLSVQDIANITGSPITSVRTLLTPGRKKKS